MIIFTDNSKNILKYDPELNIPYSPKYSEACKK